MGGRVIGGPLTPKQLGEAERVEGLRSSDDFCNLDRAFEGVRDQLRDIRTPSQREVSSNDSVQVGFFSQNFPFQISLFQDLIGICAVFTKWTAKLAKVKFGPKMGDHNLPFRGVELETLGKNLVGLAREICRVLLGLGFGHHKVPTVDDDEIEEILITGHVTAVTNNAEFVLQGSPPDRVLEWPAAGIRDVAVDNQGLRRPLIQADRGGHLSTRTSRAPRKKGGKRKRPKRAEPWVDASCPPVFSSVILERPDNSKGVLTFKRVPYLRNEIKPKTWKWRSYSLLYAVPFFGPRAGVRGAGWNHGIRYFR